MTTVQAAAQVARSTGLPVSARDVDYITRRWSADVLPPTQGGRRQWSAEHVSRLEAEVRARAPQRAAG